MLHNFLTLAQRHYTSKLIQFNHSNFNRNHAPQVPFTQNQLALAQQNSSQYIQADKNHIMNTKFALHTYLQSNNPLHAALSTNTILSTLSNAPQIPYFASPNSNQPSLADQSSPQFHSLKQTGLSFKLKSHILFVINTKNSKSLNTSRAEMLNKKIASCPF